ncbi:Uncharacterized protein TCM_020261 [Theobroma cacao]|uniref:Uncharacterized protein n=1 Tax=Theobroma cacao TaxID=3641 RepID=A0A061EKN6_THECC|nr:Uncharacterized protein TCM_020261 [Theobroma cacao]
MHGIMKQPKQTCTTKTFQHRANLQREAPPQCPAESSKVAASSHPLSLPTSHQRTKKIGNSIQENQCQNTCHPSPPRNQRPKNVTGRGYPQTKPGKK